MDLQLANRLALVSGSTAGIGFAIAHARAHTFHDGFAGGWRWRDGVGSATTTVTSCPVGTLVIDIFDTRRKEAIWRGTASQKKSPR